MWIAERLLDEAERQRRDPRVVEAQLLEAEEAHQRGELTAVELDLIEDELIGRLLPGGGQ
jgi:hypothetical protein